MSREKSYPLSTGLASRGGSATPLSPPPPGPAPPLPLPAPDPAPPAPVPGPATLAAPSVAAAPLPGVALATMTLTGGDWTFGLGAATGVALLLMFRGADAPCFCLGFDACRLSGGGGGGGLARSNTLRACCAPATSSFPDRWRNTSKSAAWIAMTARTAPPRSRALMSMRYATGLSTRQGAITLRTGRGNFVNEAPRRFRGVPALPLDLELQPNGGNWPCGLRHGLPFRPCSRSRAALLDPWPRSRAWSRRSWLMPSSFSRLVTAWQRQQPWAVHNADQG